MTTLVVNARHLKPGWKTNPQYVDVRRARNGRVGPRLSMPGYFGNP